MAQGTDYKSIIKKIDDGKQLQEKEKALVKEAIDKWLTENAVIANGIASLVKLTADEDSFIKIRQVIENARKRAESGKEQLTPEDEKKLYSALAYLRKESSEKIVNSVKNGGILFLAMLDDKLAKVDIGEIGKLQKMLKTLK
ncbi:MAG: hypothetical protein QXS93_03330 [Candidatus Micrarchaeia archaeon]